MPLDIVIVDFNAGKLVRDAVKSLGQHPPRQHGLGSITVIDNASSEPTASHLSASMLTQVDVCRNDRNVGFGVACNQGAARGMSDLILFLNPDTEVKEGTLDTACNYLASHDDVGIVGGQLLDAAGKPTVSCAEFPKARHFWFNALGLNRMAPRLFPTAAMEAFDHRSTREVEQVMGAFFMIRRSLFDKLGGFDPRFFVYFEEVDLSLRARAAGFRSVFVAEAVSIHHGQGTTDAIRATRLFLSLQSRLRYARKHFGALAFASTALVTLAIEPLSRVAMAMLRSGDAPGEVLRGTGRLYGWLLTRRGLGASVAE